MRVPAIFRQCQPGARQMSKSFQLRHLLVCILLFAWADLGHLGRTTARSFAAIGWPSEDASRLQTPMLTGRAWSDNSRRLKSNWRSTASGSAEAPVASSATASSLNLAKNLVGSGILSLPAGVAAFSSSPAALGPSLAVLFAAGFLCATPS
eukprot:TRINITY_DN19508_c0_g1_i4.p1 TRINITY_DN19508_c0_g1~~TRINITY_DN19508_c0_g1_i4.p1  ORF type:complete len:151 (-),score=27.86 TRINITY_DN19508_c0_g1_i4:233-685(-)